MTTVRSEPRSPFWVDLTFVVEWTCNFIDPDIVWYFLRGSMKLAFLLNFLL